MTGPLRNSGKALAGSLALGLVVLLPLEAAAGIAFRNDLRTPVVVQGESIVNGMVRRGQPVPIPSGRVGQDPQVPVGLRQITIYDASRPGNPVLDRETVPYTGQNLRFIIRQGPAGSVQLVPADKQSP